MTDQKPDRQDDGLLRLADKIGKDIACTRTYSMNEWAIIEAVLRSATSPTRDSAEGAGNDLPLDAEHPINYRKAFAKPAPDAMREVRARLIYEAANPSDPKDAWREALRISDAIAVLSAPVPPADGTLCYSCPCGIGDKPCPNERGELQCALSPSPAVAAADDQDPPMKWLIGALRDLAGDLLADPKTPWIGERDPKQHICWTAADRLASPPVRGDRESIKNIVTLAVSDGEWLGMNLNRLEPSVANETRTRAINARTANFLSLPVQSGAGEREPTPDMRIAGGVAWAKAWETADTYVDCADACWKAMWDAR